MNQSRHVLRVTTFLFLVVLATQTAGAESKLYFPRISTSGINGLTIFNPGPGPAAATAGDDEITMRLYGTKGDLVAGKGITNPTVLEVPAGQNTAVTAVAVFGRVDPSIVGWVEATSSADGLTGFFSSSAATRASWTEPISLRSAARSPSMTSVNLLSSRPRSTSSTRLIRLPSSIFS